MRIQTTDIGFAVSHEADKNIDKLTRKQQSSVFHSQIQSQ